MEWRWESNSWAIGCWLLHTQRAGIRAEVSERSSRLERLQEEEIKVSSDNMPHNELYPSVCRAASR